MKKTSLVISVFGLACVLLVRPVHALDLWQAYELAQANDATYKAASAQKIATDEQKKQARAALLPTVVAAGALRSTRETFHNQDRVSETYPASATVTFTQPLIQLDSLTAFKQVNSNVNIGELTLEAARQDLISRVVQAYFNGLLTQKTSQVAMDKQITAEQQRKMAQRNFDVGNTTIIDVQEAAAAYHRAEAEAITAKSNADNALATLEDMIGQPINEPLAALTAPLKLKMPVPDSQAKWVERAQAENYNVRIAKLSLDIAKLEVTKRAKARLPKLDFVASQTWKVNDKDVKSRVTSVGLELSMPIFDGGLIGAQVREAEAFATKSFQTVRSTQTQVAQSTRSSYNQAVSGLKTIAALEEAQKASAASVRSNRIGYDLGMRINIDVLNAQQTDAQTKIDLAQAQYNTVIGNVNLKAAIGQLRDDDVRYINQLLESSPKTLKEQAIEPTALQQLEDPKSTSRTVVVKPSQ
jgi:outer membrane protein